MSQAQLWLCWMNLSRGNRLPGVFCTQLLALKDQHTLAGGLCVFFKAVYWSSDVIFEILISVLCGLPFGSPVPFSVDLLISFLKVRPGFNINLQPGVLLKLCGVCLNRITERRRSQKPETLLVHVLARPEDTRSSPSSVTASTGSGGSNAECRREECPSHCSLQVHKCCVTFLRTFLHAVAKYRYCHIGHQLDIGGILSNCFWNMLGVSKI